MITEAGVVTAKHHKNTPAHSPNKIIVQNYY
jgi:hypothetical protein